MYIERHSVTVTTDADGDGTGYTPVASGRVLAIIYTEDGTNPYDTESSSSSTSDTGGDFLITAEATGETIWNESNIAASTARYPRTQVHDTSGTALTLDGTRKNVDYIHLSNDRVKIVVSGGGNTNSGTFKVIIG